MSTRAGAGLNPHHADLMGNDVVQLARDPHALIEHGPPRVLLALALQRPRAIEQLGGPESMALPSAHVAANSPA